MYHAVPQRPTVKSSVLGFTETNFMAGSSDVNSDREVDPKTPPISLPLSNVRLGNQET
jgi:hypothetical protein